MRIKLQILLFFLSMQIFAQGQELEIKGMAFISLPTIKHEKLTIGAEVYTKPTQSISASLNRYVFNELHRDSYRHLTRSFILEYRFYQKIFKKHKVFAGVFGELKHIETESWWVNFDWDDEQLEYGVSLGTKIKLTKRFNLGILVGPKVIHYKQSIVNLDEKWRPTRKSEGTKTGLRFAVYLNYIVKTKPRESRKRKRETE